MPKLTAIPWRHLERVFERLGYTFSHQEGSHRIYTRPGSPRPVVIPAYGEVPVFIIQRNLRTAGATREQYFQILDEV